MLFISDNVFKILVAVVFKVCVWFEIVSSFEFVEMFLSRI